MSSFLPYHHVLSDLSRPKTIMVCIRIILKSLTIKRMKLFFPYNLFELSTVGTSCAPLETSVGTTCPLCCWHGSRVEPRILQGVAAVPTFWVLGLAIWAQNPPKPQNRCYEMKDKGLSYYLQLTMLKTDGGMSRYQLWKIWLRKCSKCSLLEVNSEMVWFFTIYLTYIGIFGSNSL